MENYGWINDPKYAKIIVGDRFKQDVRELFENIALWIFMKFMIAAGLISGAVVYFFFNDGFDAVMVAVMASGLVFLVFFALDAELDSGICDLLYRSKSISKRIALKNEAKIKAIADTIYYKNNKIAPEDNIETIARMSTEESVWRYWNIDRKYR